MDTRRSSSSITKLPSEVVKAVNSRLVKGTTYDDVVAYLESCGYEISRSAIGRYGKGFLKKLEHIKVLEDQARAIMAEGGSPMAMEEALSKLLTAEIMGKTLDGKIRSIKNLSFITDAFAKLQKSSVSRELMKKELLGKIEKASKEVDKIARDADIPKEIMDRIKLKYYGIVTS